MTAANARELAESWATKRAGHRKAIIAYSDLHDAFEAGFEAGRREGRKETIEECANAVEDVSIINCGFSPQRVHAQCVSAIRALSERGGG